MTQSTKNSFWDIHGAKQLAICTGIGFLLALFELFASRWMTSISILVAGVSIGFLFVKNEFSAFFGVLSFCFAVIGWFVHDLGGAGDDAHKRVFSKPNEYFYSKLSPTPRCLLEQSSQYKKLFERGQELCVLFANSSIAELTKKAGINIHLSTEASFVFSAIGSLPLSSVGDEDVVKFEPLLKKVVTTCPVAYAFAESYCHTPFRDNTHNRLIELAANELGVKAETLEKIRLMATPKKLSNDS